MIFLMIILLAGCGFSRVEEKAEPKEETHPTEEAYPEVQAEIRNIDKQGNIILDISVQRLNKEGYETGDIITVTIDERSFAMPVGLMVNEAESNEEICLFENENEANDIVKLIVKNGSFFSVAELGEVELINEDPGYRIHWKDGIDLSIPVFLNMKEKQGHSEEYPSDESVYERTSNRENYPHLSDGEYANFREVKTSGMKEGTLYRSSSPINPKMNRNLEADEAIRNAGIKTIINMADYPNGMKRYEGYENSYYQTCNIIALNMSTNFDNGGFEESLAEGYRFLIDNEGPYLIHCTEGKDRTGFSIAILECLMGARPEQIVSDYMKTYSNYYGIKLGSLVYNSIAQRNIIKDLSKALGIDSIFDEHDLSKLAEDYLLRIGMSIDEIDQLKEKLQEYNLS